MERKQVILMQSHMFNNVWSLKDATATYLSPEGGEVLTTHVDRMMPNGAFAADACVCDAITHNYDIVGINVSPKVQERDSNMDAAEGALYRAAHGAWDSMEKVS